MRVRPVIELRMAVSRRDMANDESRAGRADACWVRSAECLSHHCWLAAGASGRRHGIASIAPPHGCVYRPTVPQTIFPHKTSIAPPLGASMRPPGIRARFFLHHLQQGFRRPCGSLRCGSSVCSRQPYQRLSDHRRRICREFPRRCVYQTTNCVYRTPANASFSPPGGRLSRHKTGRYGFTGGRFRFRKRARG